MQLSLSISDLYEAAFGYRTAAYDAAFGGQGKNAFNDKGISFPQLPARQEATVSGGSPYWSKDAFGRDYYMPITLGGYELPYPVMSASLRTVTVDTPLVERGGEVTEYIGLESWALTVRGIIIDPKKQFPEKVVGELATLTEVKAPLEIICPISEMFLPVSSDGKRMVTLRGFDFPEVRGVMGVRAYEFQLRSHVDFNLLKIS